MMICIVTPFFNKNPDVSRPSFVRQTLLEKGYDVITITSEFSHTEKCNVHYDDEDIISVTTLPYKSNTSLVRFLSHIILSFSLFLRAFSYRKKIDIFYVTAPFALTALLMKIFIRKKIILDIIDFWPDSLPFSDNVIIRPFLFFWSKINLLSCSKSDFVISLSSAFLNLARAEKSRQIQFGARSKGLVRVNRELDYSYGLRMFYIGNIGSLYDFDTLVDSLKDFRGDVKLEIVGVGDRKEQLLNRLRANNISFSYHGVVYDEDRLKEIASLCNIGFNGYLNTNASFSYKALSYFSYGLPIINSMNGDIYSMVSKYSLGVNYTMGDKLSLSKAINNLSTMNFFSLTDSVSSFFDKNLDSNEVSKEILDIFEEVFNEKTV